MKICIAQLRPIKGDIHGNIKKHMTLIELASSRQATSIFFSELSLTSYEPELAKELATTQDDNILDDFQQISDINNISIGIGIPTKSETGIQISMIIFQPQSPRQTYSKQQLPSCELPYFESGNREVILDVEGTKIAPAICYESLQPDHAEKAKNLGAEIYLASVAKSQNGIDKAMLHYPKMALKHSMSVLMSNCIGPCEDFVAAGLSAVWSKQGELLGQLDKDNEGLLIFNTETEEVIKYGI